MSNFIKIWPMGSELFHADGRTDMTKQIVDFRNSTNGPKNSDEIFSIWLITQPTIFQNTNWSLSDVIHISHRIQLPAVKP